jgi:hypothetical protein
MAVKLRGVTGAYIPANGEGFPVRVNLRVTKVVGDRLAALFPASGDRMDFIRAAIAEKLERDGVLSNQEI